ncbi:hypothetical protein SDC9_114320 [bioreactor metagenome]|uniref:Uncharacterized protein n=1 Tax=bioreactor metagenome TaxID=1076179 RepID=A0A645BQK0_9ZZZZ
MGSRQGCRSAARTAGGIPFSILSGDIARLFGNDDLQFKGAGCEFLITVNGVLNTRSDAKQFNDAIAASPRYKHITSGNSVAAYNYTTYAGDFAQIIGDELGTISYPSIELASLVRKAVERAKVNQCQCYKIHVVAHSQGTSVFYNALPFIDQGIYPNIYYVGLGGERFASGMDGLGGNENYANKDDMIPYWANDGPWRWLGITGGGTWLPSTGGYGTSHPWKDYLSVFQ